MARWDKKLLWCFMLLLAGAAGQLVMYPPHVCAVSGSTVTLLCTFTPNDTFTDNGRPVRIKVIRVRWCQNHGICQSTTPSVYDSLWPNINPRYRYLGDLEKNCTLQITDVAKTDEATLRFRMEVNHTAGHFTGVSGVGVTVTDRTELKIVSSRDHRAVAEGQTVELRCSAICTFNQLEVSWFRDGHPLSESGPALLLQPLTAEHSGNYTCTLNKNQIRSDPYSLSVKAKEEEEEQNGNLPLIVGVVFVVLLALFTLIVVLLIIKRKRAAAEKKQRAVGAEEQPKVPDEVYSSIMTFDPQGGVHLDLEDVSYASVQFKHQNQTRAAEQAEDSVIYSSVASRG